MLEQNDILKKIGQALVRVGLAIEKKDGESSEDEDSEDEDSEDEDSDEEEEGEDKEWILKQKDYFIFI